MIIAAVRNILTNDYQRMCREKTDEEEDRLYSIAQRKNVLKERAVKENIKEIIVLTNRKWLIAYVRQF